MMRTQSFGYDGDDGLGDRLLQSVLGGAKTATSSLAVEYLSGDPLPRVGELSALVDSQGAVRGFGTVETTRATITALNMVGDDVAHAEGEGFAHAEGEGFAHAEGEGFAHAEGEGFADAVEWRRDHVSFWGDVADLVRADAGDPDSELREAEPVVVHWFRLVPSDQV